MIRRPAVFACLPAVLAACAAGAGPEGPRPARDTVRVVDTVTVEADGGLRPQMAQLQLQLLEREAQLDELRIQLDDARREVVRAMAKLQSLATRAEAASAMAEAEVALRQLRTAQPAAPGVGQAERLLALANTEFDGQNYAGALYLATESKKTASESWAAGGGDRRPGEVAFAAALRLQTLTRSNVRAGPGTRFEVLFTLEEGAPLVAHSHVDDWLRVSDADGRTGWIFHTLVAARR